MAKQQYEVLEAYLALGDRNVYRGNEVELDSENPGTKTLLEMGAIELVHSKVAGKIAKKVKEANNGSDD